MPAGGADARGRSHRRLGERVEGEDLRTRAPPGSGAGGDGGRGPQDCHSGEGAARVTHDAQGETEGGMRTYSVAEQILFAPVLGGAFSTPPAAGSGGQSKLEIPTVKQ